VGRVNNPKNDWMFNDSWGVDVAVNTPQLMTALVEEAVEIGDLVRLLTLQTGVSSIVEFTVPHDSHAIGLTVGDIDWPEDSTLVAILRDQAPITPSRDDVIDGGDELFFVTTIAAEDQLRELLSPGSSEGQGPGEWQGSSEGQAPGDGRARDEVPASAVSSEEAAPATADQLDDDGFDG
jgi:trk system potassium uptake protein